MKRLSIIFLAVALTVPTFAQLNGDGFYRVQNAKSKRYATIVDNKAKKPELAQGNIDLLAINTIEGFDNIVSDPGSIIYIEKHGNDGYILSGKGMNTYSVSELYIKLNPSKTTDGSYWASGRYSGIDKYLYEGYQETFDFWYFTSGSKNEDNSSRSRDWYIIPVNQEDNHYFGIKPEIMINNKCYTTLYASFAYELSTGMKAYYVKQANDKAAELVEIEGSKVPAATPVIIECSSNNHADNKVTPIIENVKTNIQNVLKGIYFCNVIKSAATGREYKTRFNWNTTDYDSNTMRVLGEVNGKLGFVKANDMKYLPANKAYLTVASTADDKIELVDAATYAAGIENIATKDNAFSKGIYTLTGSKIKTENKEGLPAGVYIIDGKKAIIRK